MNKSPRSGQLVVAFLVTIVVCCALAFAQAGGPASATLVGGLFVQPPAPTITAVSPSAVPASGGATITLTGTNFFKGQTVTFSSATLTTPVACGNVVVVSTTSMTCVTPQFLTAFGPLDVTVRNPF